MSIQQSERIFLSDLQISAEYVSVILELHSQMWHRMVFVCQMFRDGLRESCLIFDITCSRFWIIGSYEANHRE